MTCYLCSFHPRQFSPRLCPSNIYSPSPQLRICLQHVESCVGVGGRGRGRGLLIYRSLNILDLKLYLSLLPFKNDIFPPLKKCCFLTRIMPFCFYSSPFSIYFTLCLPILFLFTLSTFSFPFLYFSSIFPSFSLPLFIYFPPNVISCYSKIHRPVLILTLIDMAFKAPSKAWHGG
jgi:hypothetical protein